MPIFKIEKNKVVELKAFQFKNERELQDIIEKNLETIFSAKFNRFDF
jgi:hypothetical protein